MIILKTIKDLKNQLLTLKNEGKTIGFVPTMGALHNGHLSLIKRSNQETDFTVCSIFINPTQFNDAKDFEKYPITIEKDIELLCSVSCDLLFLPNINEMYPDGLSATDNVDFGELATLLEGEFRPGHFDGMAQIVGKLLQAVQPDFLFMGQKDYQQSLICQTLIKIKKWPVKLIVCSIEREEDGLAMSSRNVRLSAKARTKAVEIYKTLLGIDRRIKSAKMTMAEIENWGTERLTNLDEFKVEYVKICDANTLVSVEGINPKLPVVALIATWLDGVRLIDNWVVNEE